MALPALLEDAIADTVPVAEVDIVVAGIAAAFAVVAGESTVELSESLLIDWPVSRLSVVEIFEIACSLRRLP